MVVEAQPDGLDERAGTIAANTEVRVAEKFGDFVPCGFQLNRTGTSVNKRRS
jgi:hypothetical protein